VDLVPQRSPALGRAFASQLVVQSDGTIEGDPRHHLRMGEVPGRAADLPDPRVLLAPAGLEPAQQLFEQRPGELRGLDAVLDGVVGGVEQLAVDVELQLRRGRVAHTYGPRVAEAGQPLELALVEAALAGDAVHDLHVGGIAGHRTGQELLTVQ
jgi:hypothetical protein